MTADLSAYVGQTVTIGFRYWTDGAVANHGFFVDDISISGQPLDDADTDPGWASAPVPNIGNTIRVISVSVQSSFMQVHVNKQPRLRQRNQPGRNISPA